MEQKKQKKLIFWLGIIVIGVVLGFALQFVRAWTEPSQAPPGGNLGAPINTGASIQTKTGTATQKADICVDPNGNGDQKCLGDLVSFPACTLAGGVPTTVGVTTICKFSGGSCPSGWNQYSKYSETTAKTCTGAGNCGTSVTSGSHLFADINIATETVTYYDGVSSTYDCGYDEWIDGSCPCGGGCYWPCHGTYHVYVACQTCSQTPRPCMPNITGIGCIPI
jgi:hypothetical protein